MFILTMSAAIAYSLCCILVAALSPMFLRSTLSFFFVREGRTFLIDFLTNVSVKPKAVRSGILLFGAHTKEHGNVQNSAGIICSLSIVLLFALLYVPVILFLSVS